jgi:hypothetical protein
MQGERELQVVFAVLDGRYAKTSFGGVLEMRTHVRDVGDGGHDGRFDLTSDLDLDSNEDGFGDSRRFGLLNLIVNNPC